MMANQKKLQIFVSSTYIDLLEERQSAVEAILKAGHIPAGMELFTATNKTQWEVIKRWINESDVYMLILGGRYGSIEPESGKSYTHLEYEYAIAQHKPLFAVVMQDDLSDSRPAKFIEQDNKDKLSDFKNIVLSNMSAFFSDGKDIKLAIHESLGEITQDNELIGWVRGNQQNDNLANEVVKLNDENRLIREENERLKKSVIKRQPNLDITINGKRELNFNFDIPENEKFQRPQEIKKIPEHLIGFLEQKTVDEYNEKIVSIDQKAVENFNSISAEKYALCEFKSFLDIKVKNNGNLLANRVQINMTFPDELVVLLDRDNHKAIDELAELKEGQLGNLELFFTSPLQKAEDYLEAYQIQQTKKEHKFVGLAGTQIITHLMPMRMPNHNFPETFKVPLIPKINYGSSLKENELAIENNLLHGTSKTYDDYILIPKKIGKGIITISLHCEEYLESQTIEIPIEVS